MKKYLLTLLVFLTWVTVVQAQNTTTVTAVVADPTGKAYSFGSYSVTLVNTTGQQPTFGGNPNFQQNFSGASLDTNGNLSISLPSVTVMQPSPGLQWQFNVCANPQSIATVFPKPVLPCFTYVSTGTQISGASVNLTTSFNAIPIPSIPGSGGGAAAANNPNLAVPGPPVFNVQNYGAKNDGRFSGPNCTTQASGNNARLSCPNAAFAAAVNVGQRINCGSGLGNGIFYTAGSTILSVVSVTDVIVSSNASGGTSTASCAWGTVNDTAVNAAAAAWRAAQLVSVANPATYLGALTGSPVIYFPSGGYMLCGAATGTLNQASTSAGGGIVGDDAPMASWLIPCDSTASAGGAGLFINQQSGASYLKIKNIAIHGSYTTITGNAYAVLLGGNHVTENLYVDTWSGGPGFQSTGSGYNLNLNVDNTGNAGITGAVSCITCQDEFHFGGSSNNGNNPDVYVQGVVGASANTGVRFINFLADECGSQANGCTQFVNSTDVWMIGSSFFSTGSGQAINVDKNSFIHIDGGVVGTFGNDSNSSALVVQAGGVVQASDTRFIGTGTGKCMNISGQFNDNGGNSCESQFPIASGTSTGTTAVLTLTTVGANVNTNCSVGDALVVAGAGIAGYDGYFQAGATSGITAVTATTLTYTTQGSNLGALGAGGWAYCRNLQTLAGNLPKALLNNPVPNTCYITGTFAATTAAAPMCTFKTQSATNISFLKAASTTATACTVAPVVTISDGTVSETLTITTAKSIWDSSVDASSGVNTTIFKPNGTITVSNTAGTCTTPPTNFSFSYNVSPILSN